MERKGIDISTWNGTKVNFDKLKDDGIEFVIIRAGYGTHVDNKDKQFEDSYSKAKASGVPVGAYWYSYAKSTEDAKLEAQTCLKVIKDKQFEYPIYFNFDDPSQFDLSKSTKSEIVTTFCSILSDAGYYTGLYSSLERFNNGFTYNKIKWYTLWLAQWEDEPTYKHAVGMWQYTSEGTLSSVSGKVNLNIAYQEFSSEIKSAGLNGYPKEESPTEESAPEVTFTIGDKVKVKEGANWASGQMIPNWVYNTPMYIRSTPSDGVCQISKLYIGAITGVIRTDDLIKE